MIKLIIFSNNVIFLIKKWLKLFLVHHLFINSYRSHDFFIIRRKRIIRDSDLVFSDFGSYHYIFEEKEIKIRN